MAKASVKARQQKRLKIVQKYAKLRQKFKKEGNYLALDKLPRDASPVRLKNRCQLTGRPKGYLRKFGLCRNIVRQLFLTGKIPGGTKASW